MNQKVDPCSLALSDLRLVRILCWQIDLQSIPRVIKLSYGELTYLIIVLIEQEGEEIPISSINSSQVGRPESRKWFFESIPETRVVSILVREANSLHPAVGSNFESQPLVLREEGEIRECSNLPKGSSYKEAIVEGQNRNNISAPLNQAKRFKVDDFAPSNLTYSILNTRAGWSLCRSILNSLICPRVFTHPSFVRQLNRGVVSTCHIEPPLPICVLRIGLYTILDLMILV